MKETQSTLIRGFVILEKIVKADKPLSSVYLAEELGLPKQTVHRIAQQLEEEGLLQREPDGKRFTAGNRLRALARDTLKNSAINVHRFSILKELSDQIGETCNITILDGTEILYLERVETNWPYRIHLPVGKHYPLHCTASGKLFLADMKPATRKRLLKSVPLSRETPQTITDVNELEKHLVNIAKDGVGVDTGEFLDDMVAIAVPVIDNDNRVAFTVAVHAPSARKSLEELRQYLPLLRRAAQRLALAEFGIADDVTAN
ncbi:IclR family transcriptional regulator [Grimontia hollisae]|uniref:HTH-type transcriptional repressor AllR n=2 Tax=Grimontia hollisae TaxID=673 RepID=D0IB95_GRIHO|nr:IclR family transcriptional regulator [Grimontia hollisae]AMG29556.1 IclR family transcriptional regulator [Grimontia hollisae]EEY71163.1 transcriptional regulator IclR family [Grimontia hollisae CIP 101886]STO43939.1 Transcriptional regulator kdgR [Grimontia hollisae]STO57164.1 Transcriptional regulator kdgR [Grimontia hollisae]STQ75027.1 Transcriptional regulator kdgR [Grimontia hollisae]